MWPDKLVDILDGALAQAHRRLGQSSPTLGARTFDWMKGLAGGESLASYFTRPRAFPLLLLPWWLEASIRGAPEQEFQRDVVYSTVTGYYAVRLIDDLMDGDKPPPREVIPALQFFHTQFTQTYTRHFPADHPFWSEFSSSWFAAAEAASLDSSFDTVDRSRFVQVSAKKTVGAKVPLAAICHRNERIDLLAPWYGFVELFGAWHQMLNDMVGWHRDLAVGRPTYFLSHAEASSASPNSIAEWVVAEGLAWGVTEMNGWMDKLVLAARDLQSAALVAYLEERQRAIEEDWQRLSPSLTALSRLATAMR